jgi:hypothetical protein
MFFGDPTAAFANVRRAMKPGARLALIVFRTAAENTWTVGPLSQLSGDQYGVLSRLLRRRLV